MINIEKAFVTENRSVYDFFQQPGMGFYIPLYQRDYAWDKDNIDQLLDDISKGIERLSDDDEIRFLGTIITVREVNKNNIQPQDTQALPVSIEKIIDGQQRLSTIAVLAVLLYEHISLVTKKLKSHELKDDVNEASDMWRKKLLDIFSLDLGRGTPPRKPKIIRGQKDSWTRAGLIEEHYKSSISYYLANSIDALASQQSLGNPDRNKLGESLFGNIKMIDKWLNTTVRQAHLNLDDDFLPAWDILKDVRQENIWSFDRPNLKEKVDLKDTSKNSVSSILCELVQLFSVCHYLTDRCCFTIIQPSNDDWAFDMFQSLNATGTPLTAIQTFKPVVVQATEMYGKDFKSSKNNESFSKVENLFVDLNTAAQRSKLTNDFLTSFAITFNGSKLSSHFSHQRKWLDIKVRSFELDKSSLISEENKNLVYSLKESFINYLGDYAEFYKKIWIDYKGDNNATINLISASKEAELTSLLILFLKESGHKMSITILARFYKDVIDGKEDSIEKFIEAVKAIAAFYALWRSSRGNAGLDNVYRKFFKREDISSTYGGGDLNDLKGYLLSELNENEDSWKQNSIVELKYNNTVSVCKLALFISSHDTIPDTDNPGLMKNGVRNTSPYLNLSKWTAKDLSTIEHIAPKSGGDVWDKELYDQESKWFQSIGNLTLLPREINSSISNRGWKEKYLYYKHLSEKDPSKQQELVNRANSLNIVLNDDTVRLLQEASYHDHVSSLVALGEDGEWNKELVEKRTKRIVEILWNTASSWLAVSEQ